MTRLKCFMRPAPFLFFYILAFPPSAYPQRFNYDDKLFFSDSVSKVRVWTYIQGDTGFRYYQDAITAISSVLNEKGYAVEFVHYERQEGMSAQEWMNNVIRSLKRKEGFLVVATQIRQSVTGATDFKIKRITDQTGAVIVSQDQPGPANSVIRNYSGFAGSKIYLNRHTSSSDPLIPVYSRSNNAETADIGQMVRFTLTAIPKSRHPVIQSSTLEDKPANIVFEIRTIGGYMFSSRMDVAEGYSSKVKGQAGYSGGGQAGLELGLGITRKLDLVLQYRIAFSTISVNTPKQLKYGSLHTMENYYTAGVNCNFRLNEVYCPYIGGVTGALNTVWNDKYFRETWYFVFGLQGGSKFYITKWMGLSVQAEILYQVHAVNAPFLYSMDPLYVPVNAMSNMLQAGLSGGILFRFGER